MFSIILFIFLLSVNAEHCEATTKEDTVKLNPQEEILNSYLLKKKNEYMVGEDSYLKYKTDVEDSEIFKIIKIMPKGAVLGLQNINLLVDDYIFSNITYRENLYICIEDNNIKLKFSDGSNITSCWKTVSLARDEERIVDDFNDWLKNKISLREDIPFSKVENKVKNVLKIRKSFLLYKPVFASYIYHILEDLYKNNIMYIEFKGPMYNLYNLDGTKYSSYHFIQILDEVNKLFKQNHKDFLGFKYIITVKNHKDIEAFKKISKKYYNLIAGIQIEFLNNDNQNTTIIAKLLDKAKTTNIFFNVENIQENIHFPDEIVSHITRLYSNEKLFGNLLLAKLKQFNVPVELYPFENINLLKYLIINEYNLVISPNYDDINFAYYQAFVSLKTIDLKMLKQLFLNSLLFSSLSDIEKTNAVQQWEEKWIDFIKSIVKN